MYGPIYGLSALINRSVSLFFYQYHYISYCSFRVSLETGDLTLPVALLHKIDCWSSHAFTFTFTLHYICYVVTLRYNPLTDFYNN